MSFGGVTHRPQGIVVDRIALGKNLASPRQNLPPTAIDCHLCLHNRYDCFDSHPILLPLMGVPASLSPGLRTVSGAVRSLGESLSPGAFSMNSVAGREPTGRSKSRHHRRVRLLAIPPRVNRTSPPTMTVCARPRTSSRRTACCGSWSETASDRRSSAHGRVDDRDVGVGAPLERPLGNPQKLRALIVSFAGPPARSGDPARSGLSP